ncbi:LOW QUALITY PROTEIN: cytochrome P450 6B2-like [Cydia pomonella]|uniref:LOW QUALITY PROTEIN: cytochrome P450 6B2-like n=1 Tax=Cydia pomonella TaxID=82600 RepID=UPI002ADDCC12|nr:LOW QUALITY PROTEIN: cytochrome P450 6B2-like [Cydia pomonella]
MLVTALVVLVSALGLLYLYLKKKNEYWKSRGLITPKPLPLLGNYGDFILLKKNLPDTVNKICKQFPKEPIVGAYYGTEPVIIVKDPELLKLVITKDFYYFSSRDLSAHTGRELMTKNVFQEHGDTWRVIRQNLTPVFTSAKMKKMFYLIQERTQDFEKFLAREITTKQTHEVRSFMGKYTMDCIGSCIFGLETKVMQEKSDNPFVVISEKIFDFRTHKVFKNIMRTIWPNIFYGLGMSAFNQDIGDFFNKLIGGVFSDRNYTPSSRHDFIDFILGFKKNKYITGDDIKSLKNGSDAREKVKLEVDDELLVARTITMIFFAAGFETSAATMSFALFEMSKNPGVLKRVLDEVDEYLVKTEGKVTYECVSDLPYLEACLDEALRIYPVLGVLTREVVEDYHMPSGLLLEKATRVHIPVQYLHMHPDYFPDPEEFQPERFLGVNKDDIKPYTYYPFGDGPRICIGMRFAKMQMMAGLVTLLRHYTVELPPHVPRKVEFDPLAFTLQSKHKIELNFLARSKFSSQ